ncbi:isoleucine patch superfamily enzyme, carbonic anhydrase/acetyltransferase [Burkholderiales bacterium JOSHI_001]|nr:isoleucine patch superfamily enzyme, carbonic anhydrase/acetyltransferase [Burkholderiales bacterium JOSHI_001]
MPNRHKFALLATACIAAACLPSTAQTLLDATATATYIDPTAQLVGRTNISLGSLVFVAPFARLAAPNATLYIKVGNETNIQDNVDVNAATGAITIGRQVILAHGATVKGPVQVGTTGTCPVATATTCPSFVGFNAVVDGAVIQKDAMVSTLARVGPGVTIPSGRKVLSGANVTTNAQVAAKTVAMVQADRDFMNGVITVNREFAAGYAEMATAFPKKVLGIGPNPVTAFDPAEVLPTINGVPVSDPGFRNRIIGDVRIGNTLTDLRQRMGAQVSLRADEGHPFVIGSIAAMASKTTFHALETTDLATGFNGAYGFHSVVHGGGAAGAMRAGDNLVLGDWAVLFRSTIGPNSQIGYKSLVQQADLPAGSVVPECTVIIGNGAARVTSKVEWCDITP